MTMLNTGVSRRGFLQVLMGTGGAFVLGVPLSRNVLASSDAAPAKVAWAPDAYVTITPDNKVEVMVKHLEMGQGAYTGMAMLVAEELDASWDQLVAKQAPGDDKRFAHTIWMTQGTGGSTGLSTAYLQMRQVGAAMRRMLLGAASEQLGVPVDQLRTEAGYVVGGEKKLSYGELAEAARKQPIPAQDSLALKAPKDFKYIGKAQRRLDVGKTSGEVVYTADLKLPNMLTAVVAHPPRIGGKVKSFDAAEAKKMPGVAGVVEYMNGVAVAADTFWQAKKALDKVKIQWADSGSSLNSADVFAQSQKLANEKGLIAAQEGDAPKALAAADTKVELEFQIPFLAHATMEPMNCVAKVDKDSCELWSGFQFPAGDKYAATQILGLKPEQVSANVLQAGSSFGRRGNPIADYGAECIDIAKNFPGRPVKMQWTREVDTRAGWYRPAHYCKVQAGLDKDGKITVWQQDIVGKSVMMGTALEAAFTTNGLDHTSVEGSELQYDIPNVDVEVHYHQHDIPIQWLRGVGNHHTTFAKEVAMDVLAKKAGVDPVKFRQAHGGKDPRFDAVLKMAAEKSGWGKKLDKNRGMGVAVQFLFQSYAALVAEVEVLEKGFKIHHITCVLDCGVAVDPDICIAQMEGGIAYGIGMVMQSNIDIENGAVKQSNFHNYKVARMRDMPKVDVYIVPSTEPPTGVGEITTPLVPAVVVNAIAAVTGEHATKLPLL